LTTNISSPEFSALVRVLYSGVGTASPAAGFLRQCCDLLRASNGAMVIIDRQTGIARHVDMQFMSDELIVEWQQQHQAGDPLDRALARLPARRFYPRRELVSDEEWANHPHFAEWFSGLGHDDMCSARFPVFSTYECMIGFARNKGQPRFTRSELDFLDLMLPHVEQSLRLHAQIDRLSVLSDLAQEHITQIGAGLLVLNESGHINFASRLARSLLQQSAELRMDQDLIRFADPGLQEQFDNLARQCISPDAGPAPLSGGMVTIPRPGNGPLIVMVMPYRRKEPGISWLTQASRAMVLIFEQGRRRLTPPLILRDLYQLSEPEVQVCWRLANGDSLEDIGQALGVAKETLRSQLKRIFAKTGTRRQPELVRLVLLGPALWASVQPYLSTPSDIALLGE
jgi:DNA-binding CsgD family transcriptional regulator